MTDSFCPHVTVATVIERNDKFLMVEELIGGHTRFNQPAGHLDANESLIEAAVRETLEETAWNITATGFLGVCLYHAENGITYVRNTFVGSPISYDRERPLDTGIVRAHWMTRSEIEQLSDQLRSPLILSSIDQYLANEIYPLAMVGRHG